MTITSLCFTGPRPKKLPCGYDENHPVAIAIKQRLTRVVRGAIKANETRRFHSGMALGIDTWAAEIVLALKVRFPEYDIRLIASVPWPGQHAMWPSASQERYWRLLQQADEIRLGHGGPERWVIVTYDELRALAGKMRVLPKDLMDSLLKERNVWMVDQCEAVIAVYGNTGGGTKHCLDYAKRTGRQVFVIDPNNPTANAEPIT